MTKERRKEMLFKYLKGLKKPVNTWHLAEKFGLTNKRIDQLMTELAGDDLIVKTKGIKDIDVPWKRTMVNYFEVKDEYKTYQARKQKVPMNWHNPFGLGARP